MCAGLYAWEEDDDSATPGVLRVVAYVHYEQLLPLTWGAVKVPQVCVCGGGGCWANSQAGTGSGSQPKIACTKKTKLARSRSEQLIALIYALLAAVWALAVYPYSHLTAVMSDSHKSVIGTHPMAPTQYDLLCEVTLYSKVQPLFTAATCNPNTCCGGHTSLLSLV